MRSTLILRVPCVPFGGVVHLIGQHIPRVVTDVVGRAEDEVEGDILVSRRVMNILHSRLALLQNL